MAAVPTVNVVSSSAIVTLELARPETGNALEAALIEELTAAVVAAPRSGARAIVLAAAGKHFCTGANLHDLERLQDAPAPERLADASRLGALYTALLRSPLLTVAAVHGAAYGGGLGLAAACDLVIAVPDARLQFSELRLGFVPALISVFLPRRVPPARLAALFFDPEPLDGAAALAVGLVDEVAADVRSRACERARAIARKCSPAAVAATKRLLLDLTLPRLDHDMAIAARANAEQRAHPECRHGVAAVVAGKGFPSWLDE